MSTKTYHGSCQCGDVQFEADIDFSRGTGRCNCTSCRKVRWWHATIKPEAFRALAGEEKMVPNKAGRSLSCPGCGITPFGRVAATDWNDGEEVQVSVACLDDVTPDELIAAPVTYFDGLNDNWWNVPSETRHL